VVFAMPPVIRLTCLGIRQVPVELVECAEAFGTNRWQRLRKLELPLAAPTIMAGVNQTVMLALSMVVIAAMIGAKGLGGEVWKAIQRLEMGRGFEAGIGIVIVAICLDRLLQKIGSRSARR
jgi:glycine betaine/proline transport system permease protein